MHAYMDSCPKDGVLSFIELDHYSGEVASLEPLIHEYTHTQDAYEAFVRLDDNGDLQVSLEEYLRHAQYKAEPFSPADS